MDSKNNTTENKPSLSMKILLLGDSAVGKTSLMYRFSKNEFPQGLLGTAGIDYCSKKVEINGKTTEILIWDTAGQERFHTITNNLYNGAAGIILVYDVSDQNTFKNIDLWMSRIKENGEKGVEIILIGNKCDLKPSVNKEEGEAIAKKYQIQFIEVSAKEGTNVNNAFRTLATKVLDNKYWVEKMEEKSKKGQKLKKKNEGGGKKWC